MTIGLALCLLPLAVDAKVNGIQTNSRVAEVGMEVRLTVTADGDSSFCGLRVDFGDGESQDLTVNPITGLFPRTISQVFTKPGIYSVSVRGQSTLLHPACDGTAKITVTVRDAQAARKVMQETLTAFAVDSNLLKAKEGYKKAVELDPTYAPAQFGLGVTLESDGEWTSARQAFQVVIDVAPRSVLAGAAKNELSKIDAALRLEATSDGKLSRQYDLMIAEARAFLESGQLSAASMKAMSAQKLDGSRWQAYAVVGEVAFKSNLSREALRFYEAAAARAPEPSKGKLLAVIEGLQSK